MDAARFQNMLRTMWNLDRHDLVEHGGIEPEDGLAWLSFRDAPHASAVRMDEVRFSRLFALIESRQPKRAADPMVAEMLAILKLVAAEAFQNEGQIWRDTADKVAAVIGKAEDCANG